MPGDTPGSSAGLPDDLCWDRCGCTEQGHPASETGKSECVCVWVHVHMCVCDCLLIIDLFVSLTPAISDPDSCLIRPQSPESPAPRSTSPIVRDPRRKQRAGVEGEGEKEREGRRKGKRGREEEKPAVEEGATEEQEVCILCHVLPPFFKGITVHAESHLSRRSE